MFEVGLFTLFNNRIKHISSEDNLSKDKIQAPWKT